MESSGDDRPNVLLASFSIFDEEGHLVDLQSGTLERGADLFFTGVAKPLVGDGGIKIVRGGPLKSWWTTGHSQGETPTVCFSTGRAGAGDTDRLLSTIL